MSENIFEHEINQTREILGKTKVDVLQDVFDNSKGNPPKLGVVRYRADHFEIMDVLDILQSEQLLRFDNKHENYLFFPPVLPILSGERRNLLLEIMERLFQYFKELYKARLREPVSYKEIRAQFPDDDESDLKLSLFYLSDIHDVFSGRSSNFPYAAEESVHNEISINESILRRSSILDVLMDYWRWHYLNPRNRISEDKVLDDMFVIGNGDNGFFAKSSQNIKPEWFDQLDEPVQVLISEVDTVLKSDCRALVSMGVRAIIEHVMVKKIGDKGTFGKNIEAFAEAGYITAQHASLLSGVIDVGNASIHRAHIPSKESVKTCIDVLKHMLEGIYVLQPQVEKVVGMTPARPKRGSEK